MLNHIYPLRQLLVNKNISGNKNTTEKVRYPVYRLKVPLFKGDLGGSTISKDVNKRD